MTKHFVAAIFLFLLVGCASMGGEKVDDFTKLSVSYGWLNIDDVDANWLHSVVIFQHRPHSDKPYYHVAVKEFEGGYLYYSFAFPNGAFAAYSAEGQSCLGFICSNTIYSYNFGKQGDDVAALLIEKPAFLNFFFKNDRTFGDKVFSHGIIVQVNLLRSLSLIADLSKFPHNYCMM